MFSRAQRLTCQLCRNQLGRWMQPARYKKFAMMRRVVVE